MSGKVFETGTSTENSLFGDFLLFSGTTNP